jgi:hypothetical protein
MAMKPWPKPIEAPMASITATDAVAISSWMTRCS